MESLPIIQSFLDRPVRFFKARFEIEMRCHNDTQSSSDLYPRYGGTGMQQTILQTWAIPLPDYSRAIGYPDKKIFEMIKRNKDVFDGFYRTELILDRSGGQRRNTILMAVEMCDGLNMKLHTTRIKDPGVREFVVRFQRWVLLAFHALRTGKLRPSYWRPKGDVLDEYERVLLLPMGRETSRAVKALAEKDGRSLQQEYRRLQKIRGSNALTSKGKPRKSPSFKGTTRYPEERAKVMTFITEHPEYLGHGNRFKDHQKKEIHKILGLQVSCARMCAWIREAGL